MSQHILRSMYVSQKDARLSKLKNIPLSDNKEVEVIENTDFKYLSNRASLVEFLHMRMELNHPTNNFSHID